MPSTLKDVVVFRKDKLFSGAVDAEWFYTDTRQSEAAAKNFVFHGPQSHAARQEDLHSTHKLVDTATFAVSLLKRSYGFGDSAFSMVIAGYGSGKSHLVLTLGHLLHDKSGECTEAILEALSAAAPELADVARKHIATDTRPALVVPINGMGQFDLTSEFTARIRALLLRDGHDVTPIDSLRPRFRDMARILNMASNAELNAELLEESGKPDLTSVYEALDSQDESIYAAAHKIIAKYGFNYRSTGAESLKDLLNQTAETYCGDGRPNRSMVILFDEFGKYMEFATVQPHKAGGGVLQELFEGIQTHSSLISFVGFIQYELGSYSQRLAPTQQNEFKRYGTRYESAEKAYLSTNIETLIANLIERKADGAGPAVDDHVLEQTMLSLQKRFPLATSVTSWSDSKIFQKVIADRCWPLSPYAMWFVYYLSAAGKYLQGRSALNLLDEAFSNLADQSVQSLPSIGLPPVSLWTEALQTELISAEDSGLQGSITISYATIETKYAGRLTPSETAVLRAVVIAAKTSMSSVSRQDAIDGLALLAGLSSVETTKAVSSLQEEYNVMEWDQSTRSFELVGDSAHRMQFRRALRQKADKTYDQQARAALFNRNAAEYCDVFSSYDTSFAEQHGISTQEWKFASATASLQDLPVRLDLAARKWHDISAESTAVDKPKGCLFYVYVSPQHDIEEQKGEIRKKMVSIAKDYDVKGLPFLCVLIHDEEGDIGHALAELDIIAKFSAEEQERYANLIPAHKEKLLGEITSRAKACIRKRHYVCLLKKLDRTRISDVCLAVFESLYPTPIAFPFDGFGTARGNASTTCVSFIRLLLTGRLDMHYLRTSTTQDKSRCDEIFVRGWQILGKDGIMLSPKYALLKKIFKEWDARLKEAPLSLWALFKELALPPYGASFASAQLAIACFIAGRLDSLLITASGKGYTPEEWSPSVFSSKTLLYPNWGSDASLSLLGDTPDEWKSLMVEWASAETYCDICECCDKAESLDERIPVPHALVRQYMEMRNESDVARQKQVDYVNRLNKALDKLEMGQRLGNFHLILSGASRLKSLMKDMEKEPGKWTQEEISKAKEDYPAARTLITQLYPEWKTTERPRNYTLDAVNKFRSDAKEEITRLRLIDLQGEADDYEAIAASIRRQAEHYAKIAEEKAEMERWCESAVYQTKGKKLIELKQMKDLGRNYLRKTKVYADVQADFKKLVARLNDVILAITAEENDLKGRLGTILAMTFDNPDGARRLAEELSRLIDRFEGDERNIGDMEDMRSITEACLEAYGKLDSFRGTKEDFEKLLRAIVDEKSNAIMEAELEWDAEAIFSVYAQQVISEHDAECEAWWQKITQTAKGLTSMSAADAESLKSRASTPPAWGAAEYLDRIEGITKQIEARLEEVEVDWILARFQKLNADTRKELIRRMIAEVGV